MNEKMKEFIDSVGLMVELWTVIYKQFIDHGFNKIDALEHTGSLIKVFISSIGSGFTNQGGN